MLTKDEDVRPKKGIKSPLKNVFMSAAYLEIFLLRRHQILTYISSVFFSAALLSSILRIKKGSREV